MCSRDPFVGENFLALPGRGPAHENFSNHPMPEGSPFRVPWWFRRELELAELRAGEQVWLRFEGLNYRAALWLNGELVAGPEQLCGAYRSFDLCVSERVSAGSNVLALEVSPPQANELAITWVDWNPSPPDKNMGLWRQVWLRRTGKLALFHAHVVSKLVAGGAELTLHVDVENPTPSPVTGKLSFELDGQRFARLVEVAPRTRVHVEVLPEQQLELRLSSPRLWWPRRMGEAALYSLTVELEVDGQTSDREQLRFGIREVTSELVGQDHALFRVNGRPLLVRGGGWAGDMLQRAEPERVRQQYEYAKELGLNTLRFEGMLPDREFLERCDADGMLVIAGFCCCDHWEKWDNWKAEDYEVSAESLRSQIRRLRHHPSLLSFWYGSDFPPPRAVEERYLGVLDEEHWPNPSHSSAAAKPTELTGPSGLKMAGPYDYVPPAYWLSDQERGRRVRLRHGDQPRTSDPARRELAQHARRAAPLATGPRLDTACRRRSVQEPRTLRYRAVQALRRATRRRRLRAQGAAHDLRGRARHVRGLHGAEVSRDRRRAVDAEQRLAVFDLAPLGLVLRPAGGYFGTKKACEALHAQYSYGAHAVFVSSELWRAFEQLELRARLFDLEARELWSESVRVDVPADGVVRALELPTPAAEGVRFLKLELYEGSALVSSNFYWLSARPDRLDHENGTGTTRRSPSTPTSRRCRSSLRRGSSRELGSSTPRKV